MSSASQQLGRAVPRKFFMSLRDLSFWYYSARADSLLKKLRSKQNEQQAFESLYGALSDPWSTTVPYYRYQLRKYQVMLSCLPARSYGRALDIGCGLGVLTRMLAPAADEVLGVDFSRNAVDRAAELSANGRALRRHPRSADRFARTRRDSLARQSFLLPLRRPFSRFAADSRLFSE